jgi:hypothetical protein
MYDLRLSCTPCLETHITRHTVKAKFGAHPIPCKRPCGSLSTVALTLVLSIPTSTVHANTLGQCRQTTGYGAELWSALTNIVGASQTCTDQGQSQPQSNDNEYFSITQTDSEFRSTLSTFSNSIGSVSTSSTGIIKQKSEVSISEKQTIETFKSHVTISPSN